MKRTSAVLAACLLCCLRPVTALSDTPPAPLTLGETVLATMDKTVDPCTDFYQYACGGWLNSFELPPEKSSYTRSFSSIAERNETLIRSMLEEAAASDGSNPDQKRIGDMYGACMDEAGIEAAGITPIQPMLTKIHGVSDLKSVMHVAGEIQKVGGIPFLAGYVDGDFTDPDTSILHIVQGGLGMPDRDYYLSADPDMVKIRAEYLKTVSKMLTLAGEGDTDAKAQKIFDFELKLAKIHKPQDELRDPETTYHKIDRVGMQKLAKKLPFDEFFAGMDAANAQAINVTDPTMVKALGKLVSKTDIETLKLYLEWQYIGGVADLLTKDFVDADFAFFKQTLVGQKQDRPRWKKCVDRTNGAFGEIVGKQYAEKMFAGESKKIAMELVTNLGKAFNANLPAIAWMDDSTRARATEKLGMFHTKIGYPDKWRDYSSITTSKTDFFGNVMGSRSFENARQMVKVGGKADKDEWLMSPADVNAYYNPTTNEIAFPAGILQPPFFSADYPQAMNYGAIGMVIGHEMTHGFDDSGRKFDGSGRLKEWWDPSAAEKFEVQAACVSKQYSGYKIREGLNVNGDLTLGENIADMGGIKESFVAYHQWVAEHGAETSPVEGLTPDQLFFVGFAQGWCSERTPEIEQLYATVDPHSPPRFRVNGPLAMFNDFATAFSCAEGTPMNPTEECAVW